jgi:hypothetical protein
VKTGFVFERTDRRHRTADGLSCAAYEITVSR